MPDLQAVTNRQPIIVPRRLFGPLMHAVHDQAAATSILSA